MSYNGYDSDAAVAATSRRRRRRGEICRSFTCISPWFIFWRWFDVGKSRVSKNRFAQREWGKEKIDGGLDSKPKSGIVSSSFRQSGSGTSKEASFNLGIGLGLIYLVRNELNKMVELRKRIELLLQNFHTEFEDQETEQQNMPSRSSISSLSKARVQEIMYDEEHDDSGQCFFQDDVQRPQIGSGSNRFRRGKSLKLDQLEAELEAEFDRMHIQKEDKEMLLNYPEVNMEESADNEFYGVSPKDLETKLHEVLEARQQEKIDELESALDYAMQQLEEKERELSCWKHTARLVSQHLPFVPSLLRQLNEAMETEFQLREMHKSFMRNECHIQASN